MMMPLRPESIEGSALAILGPTASGKTALALRIAEQINCEIISLDSALVYRDMNIGTAKPTAAELASVPHHLIDIISPTEAYSAADFASDCLRLCGEIQARGRLPLIVGGTMMYFQALTQGLNDLPSADAAIRADLHAQREQHGIAHLYQQLQTHDPATACRLQPNDTQRIERALEVFLLTGKPMSELLADSAKTACPLDLHTIALIPEDRSRLHQQIALRFEQMLANGFVDEVKHLQAKYPELSSDDTSMRCVGYRQAWDYLAGQDDYETFVEKGIVATRQLAKRQLTWLRKLPSDTQLDPYQNADLLQTALPLAQKMYAKIKTRFD